VKSKGGESRKDTTSGDCIYAHTPQLVRHQKVTTVTKINHRKSFGNQRITQDFIRSNTEDSIEFQNVVTMVTGSTIRVIIIPKQTTANQTILAYKF